VFRECLHRSILKSISWRVLGSLATAYIVLFVTHRWDYALGAGLLDWSVKILLFIAHERMWDKVALGKQRLRPCVIWITGFSGAGKTTLGKRLLEHFTSLHLPVEFLDGDSIRHIIPGTGFSRQERNDHVQRVGFLASRLESHSVFCVAALISPYAESRDFARSLCKNFLEVYLSTPIAECEARDVKGLYKKARTNEIGNFTGISAPYEPPQNPELTLDTSQLSIDECMAQIVKLVHAKSKLKLYSTPAMIKSLAIGMFRQVRRE
jgi:adenylylsulfate kinase